MTSFVKWSKTLSHSPQVSRLPLLLSYVIFHEAFMAQVIGSKRSVTMSKDGRLWIAYFRGQLSNCHWVIGIVNGQHFPFRVKPKAHHELFFENTVNEHCQYVGIIVWLAQSLKSWGGFFFKSPRLHATSSKINTDCWERVAMIVVSCGMYAALFLTVTAQKAYRMTWMVSISYLGDHRRE